MDRERDRTMYNDESKIKLNLSEIEELMSLLDPDERIFVQSKQLVKEMKIESNKNIIDKNDDSILRR